MPWGRGWGRKRRGRNGPRAFAGNMTNFGGFGFGWRSNLFSGKWNRFTSQNQDVSTIGFYPRRFLGLGRWQGLRPGSRFGFGMGFGRGFGWARMNSQFTPVRPMRGMGGVFPIGVDADNKSSENIRVSNSGRIVNSNASSGASISVRAKAKEILEHSHLGNQEEGSPFKPIIYNGEIVGYVWSNVNLSDVQLGSVFEYNGERRISLLKDGLVVGYLKV